VGRFLEHSRIFYFANGLAPGQAAWYFGSADLMPRNLDRRVEAVVPVDDSALQERLAQILEVNLSDDELAWELHHDGAWTKVERSEGVNTHVALRAAADERARRREAEAAARVMGP
jgi:polyphosphate kinase